MDHHVAFGLPVPCRPTLPRRAFSCQNRDPPKRRAGPCGPPRTALLAAVERVGERIALAHRRSTAAARPAPSTASAIRRPASRHGSPRARPSRRRRPRRSRSRRRRSCLVGGEQAVGHGVEHALADPELGGAPRDRLMALGRRGRLVHHDRRRDDRLVGLLVGAHADQHGRVTGRRRRERRHQRGARRGAPPREHDVRCARRSARCRPSPVRSVRRCPAQAT